MENWRFLYITLAVYFMYFDSTVGCITKTDIAVFRSFKQFGLNGEYGCAGAIPTQSLLTL